MTQTYSSSQTYVEDGDTTAHTTPEDINITSAQIRWEGISGYPQTKTRPAENALGLESVSADNSGTFTFPMPPRASATTAYDSSRLAFNHSGTTETTDIEIVAPDGTTLVSDTLNSGETQVYTWSNASTDGSDVTVNYSSDESDSFTLRAVYRETTGTYDTNGGDGHDTVSDSTYYSFSNKQNDFSTTLQPSFPSVPNEVLEYLVTLDFDTGTDGSWQCDFHVDYDDDGTAELTGSIFLDITGDNSPWGGFEETVTFHIPVSAAASTVPVTLDISPIDADGSITASAETRFVTTTKNPSVTGDVSGSYNGIIKDGVLTPWQPLSGLTEGTNKFAHDINEAKKGNVEFEYTYEFVGPDDVAVLRVQHDGDVYELPLADPTDSALENKNLRVNVNNQVLVADLVDTSDKNATPVRAEVPNHGTLAWRKNL